MISGINDKILVFIRCTNGEREINAIRIVIVAIVNLCREFDTRLYTSFNGKSWINIVIGENGNIKVIVL